MSDALTPDDRLEIRELFARWSRAEDTGASEDWAALFTEDGRCSNGRGETMRGHAELLRNSQERWRKATARRSVHWMGEAVIDPAEDGARARHTSMLIETVDGGGYRIRSLSERTYDVCRPADAWLIRSREFRRLPASED
ncbi:hypothetical protein RVR_8719 [Actinacidiphila reveromycinica]|uniref:SnoaL-like domain-containing protein n=1 Tax=Actinacidiphila reveromycinica TaxID=659352 RepID=A0A7U3VS08_9ACTN|nr:nuclear transport factor 2 family protein [Streptomyces sp. SN-593]BBB01350.1 hypothetical protein RVR_8719 [Streptomyces sp. SN-593]